MMGAAYPELGRAQALITETLALKKRALKPRWSAAEIAGRRTAKSPRAVAGWRRGIKLYDTFAFRWI